MLLSFLIAASGCLFAGLCYAELASMIPQAGSAYTYTYATMGRFMAWFIGWNMVLEYRRLGLDGGGGLVGLFPQSAASVRDRLSARLGQCAHCGRPALPTCI